VNNDGEIYYNEFDAYCGQWLRNLGNANEIPCGFVDERSICDVVPTDLCGYQQCHFFAGIGIWARALKDAGWPDEWPVWTGSCPCQPFSSAGKRGGFDDERHLWPAWFWHIQHERPDTIFGEQVTGADEWVDLVRGDLEGIGYTFGCAEIPSAGFGAANIRARTYWLAHTNGQRGRTGHDQSDASANWRNDAERRGIVGGMADANGNPTRRNTGTVLAAETESGSQRLINGDYLVRPRDGGNFGGFPDRLRLGGDPVEWVYCRDEKWRPIEPGTLPLAASDSSTVGRLRAYGNAINLRTATEFVRAFLDIEG